tara:strand:- start:35 stop:394 length:360 start_codon:yes stop_codon:yes gene_type:complete
MMGIEHILALADEQAALASRRKTKPMRIPRTWAKYTKTERVEKIGKIPNIGNYVHPDWERVDHFMVDKTGIDDSGPALSLDQLIERVKLRHGYAIIEEGQFQLVVGEFEHILEKYNRRS